MSYEKKIYLPGVVARYQKPWFTFDGSFNVKYNGQFCEKGYWRVFLSFEPLQRLIDEVSDPDLKERMTDIVEEMEDAYYAKVAEHDHCGIPVD